MRWNKIKINSKELLIVADDYFKNEIFNIIKKDLDKTYGELSKQEFSNQRMIVQELYRLLIVENGNEPSVERMKELLTEWQLTDIYMEKDLSTRTAFRKIMYRKLKDEISS